VKGRPCAGALSAALEVNPSGGLAAYACGLIGEATRQAAQHTGPGIGGFLNASLGHAPELVIALVAGDLGRRRLRGSCLL
jgi:Ca2+/H+ antiporter